MAGESERGAWLAATAPLASLRTVIPTTPWAGIQVSVIGSLGTFLGVGVWLGGRGRGYHIHRQSPSPSVAAMGPPSRSTTARLPQAERVHGVEDKTNYFRAPPEFTIGPHTDGPSGRSRTLVGDPKAP